jgi:2-dehydropantoate 2-reductase
MVIDMMIMGAGAIGSLFGGLLADAGYDAVLVGRKEHVDAIRDRGLRISGLTEKVIDVKAATEPIPARTVLLTVKSYDTEEAMRSVPLRSETVIVSIQNGLNNVERIESIVGAARTIGGVTSHGSLFISPGHIRHTGTGDTIIGGRDRERAMEVAEMFNHASIRTMVRENIMDEIWKKLIVNVGINAPTALTGIKNGMLLETNVEWVMVKAVEEAISVARRMRMGYASVEDVRIVAKMTAENKSSMLQDVRRGKRTEIDAINGEIVRIGEELGIPTPVNRTLYSLIKSLEIR